MSARIGGIIAPQIVLLVSMWEVEIKIVLVLQKILKIQMLTGFKGNAWLLIYSKNQCTFYWNNVSWALIVCMCIMGRIFITRIFFFFLKINTVMENNMRFWSIFHNCASIQKYMRNESNNEIMAMECFSLSYVLCTIKYGCSKLLQILLIFFIDVCKQNFFF